MLSLPVWWYLGLGYFAWPLMTPALVAMASRRGSRVPAGFGLWMLFLLCMAASSVELDSGSRGLAFAYRIGLGLAATLFFLILYSDFPRRITGRAVLYSYGLYWGIIIAGGFVAMWKPNLSFTTLAQHLTPGTLQHNEFVYSIVHPSVTEQSNVLHYSHPRPDMFFSYTNHWGAAVAFLTPFVLGSLSYARSTLARCVIACSLIAALIPVVWSLNRGLWLSLGIAAVYLGLRRVRRTRKVWAAAALLVAVLGAAVLFTPLGTVTHERFSTRSSTAGRAALYDETEQRVLASPVLGYGAPRPSTNQYQPSAGTQSEIGLIAFSNGIPALVLFVSWFTVVLWRTRHVGSGVGFWCHLAVLVAVCFSPFYEWAVMLPLIMGAAAVALREAEAVAVPCGRAT